LGDKIDDQLAVRTQRLLENGPPPAERCLALAQKRADEALESLGQCGVWDVALVLVELTGREEAAQRDQGLVQLVHDGGFADTGIPGYEHELCCAVRYDPAEGAKQHLDLVLPAVELLRNEQSVWRVVRAEQERLYTAMRLPFREALAQIDREARGGLVAVLGILGE